MGNSSSKKNGESSQSKNERIGPKQRMEPPRVSMVMRMSRISRISMDNAFKQYVTVTLHMSDKKNNGTMRLHRCY